MAISWTKLRGLVAEDLKELEDPALMVEFDAWVGKYKTVPLSSPDSLLAAIKTCGIHPTLGASVERVMAPKAQGVSDVHFARLERQNDALFTSMGDFVEDNIRQRAAALFGSTTLERLAAQSLHDLVILSSPHGTSQEQIHRGVLKLQTFAQKHCAEYVQALYVLARQKVKDDPSNLFEKYPWVTDGKVEYANIGACFNLVKTDGYIGNLVQRVLFMNPNKRHDMDPLLRSDGPGLSIVLWMATGKLGDELEWDCRGKVDLLNPTHRAVVMGAEIKSSSNKIGEAKIQLIVRFKVIRLVLSCVYNVNLNQIIFLGRVFYRNVTKGSQPPAAEDGSGHDLAILSFYYHQM